MTFKADKIAQDRIELLESLSGWSGTPDLKTPTSLTLKPADFKNEDYN